MSYAGKVGRNRGPGAPAGSAHARGVRGNKLPERGSDRSLSISGRRRNTRAVPDESLELDWQRVTLFTAGIAIGMLVGAGAALLGAPQSGAETRHDLARQGRRLGVRTRDAWDDLRDELRWASQRGRRRLGRRMGRIRAERADRHEERRAG